MALWGKILGLVGGGAVAGAAASVAEPALEGIRQEAWTNNAVRVIAAEIAARAVAEGLMEPGTAYNEGTREGIDNTRMDYMIELAKSAPDTGTLIELLRRDFINSGNFTHGTKKAGLENDWDSALQKLKDSILSVADIANAVQQGFVPGDGILRGDTGGTHGINIPVDVVDIDPVTEAKHSGYDSAHLKVFAELAGLPPGPGELMQMLNRGIITDSSFDIGIREGHTKTKWTSALRQLRYGILSPVQAANLRLRGWIDDTEMYQLGSLGGYSEDLMHKLWQMQGRPPGPAQLQTAYNRKLIDFPTFHKGIQESDVRDEWTNTLFELRARYPTPFALRQLASTGGLTVAEVTNILELEGYPPDLAAKMAKAWATGKTAPQKQNAVSTIETLYEARYIDAGQASSLLTKLGYTADEITLILELGDARRVKKFLDAAVGKIHTLYVDHKLPDADAVNELNALNISQQAIADLISEWSLERAANIPQLSPAQWAAAAYYAIVTRDEAINGIKSLGYDDTNARILVDIRAHGIPTGQVL
jgi:hypothetical protein